MKSRAIPVMFRSRWEDVERDGNLREIAGYAFCAMYFRGEDILVGAISSSAAVLSLISAGVSVSMSVSNGLALIIPYPYLFPRLYPCVLEMVKLEQLVIEFSKHRSNMQRDVIV